MDIDKKTAGETVLQSSAHPHLTEGILDKDTLEDTVLQTTAQPDLTEVCALDKKGEHVPPVVSCVQTPGEDSPRVVSCVETAGEEAEGQPPEMASHTGDMAAPREVGLPACLCLLMFIGCSLCYRNRPLAWGPRTSPRRRSCPLSPAL